MVKRLRHHPFTVVTGVRFPLESPKKFRTFSTSVFSILFWGNLTPVMRFASRPAQAARSRALRSLKGDSPWSHHLLTNTNIFTFVFFYKPLLCVSLRDPHRLHARAPCARCKAIPLGVTINLLRTLLSVRFLCSFSGNLTPVMRLASRPAQAARSRALRSL